MTVKELLELNGLVEGEILTVKLTSSPTLTLLLTLTLTLTLT